MCWGLLAQIGLKGDQSSPQMIRPPVATSHDDWMRPLCLEAVCLWMSFAWEQQLLIQCYFLQAFKEFRLATMANVMLGHWSDPAGLLCSDMSPTYSKRVWWKILLGFAWKEGAHTFFKPHCWNGEKHKSGNVGMIQTLVCQAVQGRDWLKGGDRDVEPGN